MVSTGWVLKLKITTKMITAQQKADEKNFPPMREAFHQALDAASQLPQGHSALLPLLIKINTIDGQHPEALDLPLKIRRIKLTTNTQVIQSSEKLQLLLDETIECAKKARKTLADATEEDAILKAKEEVTYAKSMMTTVLALEELNKKSTMESFRKSAEKKQKENFKAKLNSEEELAFAHEDLQDEYDDLIEAENKANRMWYDITKWTRAEIIGRLFIVSFYAFVCGVASYVGLQEQSTIPFLATAGGAILGGIITTFVNGYGFWDNVSNIFKKTRRSEKPTGNWHYAYMFAVGLFVIAALVNAAGQARPIIELISDEGNGNYWQNNWPTLIFAPATAIALIGLFTQAPRQWFAKFSKKTFADTMKNGMNEITYGVDTVPEGAAPEYSKAGASMRWMLFFGLNAIFVYAAWAMIDYAGKGLINTTQDSLSNSITSENSVAWMNQLIVPLGYVFLVSRSVYNATIAQKLAIGASGFLVACKNVGVQQYQKLQNEDLSKLGVFKYAFAPLLIIPYVLFKAEAYCWMEAVRYARIQYNIKQSYFFLPHIFGHAFFNHINVMGLINAINNGAQNGHFYREGLEKPEGVPLNKGETLKSWLSELTGTLGSLGFYLFAAKPRADRWKNNEKYMDMEPGKKSIAMQEIKNSAEDAKKKESTLWGYSDFPNGATPKIPHQGSPSLFQDNRIKATI